MEPQRLDYSRCDRAAIRSGVEDSPDKDRPRDGLPGSKSSLSLVSAQTNHDFNQETIQLHRETQGWHRHQSPARMGRCQRRTSWTNRWTIPNDL